jgi:NAD(P)-dependent dehydrogenase (short-subunit alcohol dehydrogenase family)
MRLRERTALVTGAGSGIGAGIALALAGFGADVAVLDKDGETAQRTAEQVRGAGRRALALRADVTQRGQVEAALERAAAELGGLEILVNNAGVAIARPAIRFDDATFDEQIALNLKSVFYTARWAAQRWIREGTPGVIINIATTEGIRGCPNFAPYSAAKAGMINLTKTLSSELGPYGIRVNAVAPDYTQTPGTRIDLSGSDANERMDRIARFIPLRRLGTPDDTAGAVVFLASGLSSWISGQTLVVDGGSLACARVEGPLPFPDLR